MHRAPSRVIVPALLLLCVHAAAAEFQDSWSSTPDRVWIGPDFWANRLHDWRIRGGRVECIADAPRLGLRTLHLLSSRLATAGARVEARVRLGALAEGDIASDALAGILLGAGGAEMDHRAAAIVHWKPGRGAGLLVVIDARGKLILRDQEAPGPDQVSEGRVGRADDVELTVVAERVAGGRWVLRAAAQEAGSDEPSAVVEREIEDERLVGNIALVSHPGSARGRSGGEPTGFWFRDLRVAGDRVDHAPARRFGPILSAQHTLSRGVLKMTAQLPPIGESEPDAVRLEVLGDEGWTTLARSTLIVPGWTATFRVADWDSSRDHAYRVAYDGADERTHYWRGTIRRDPADRSEIVVAAFTGNHNNSHRIGQARFDWTRGMWFPHADLTRRLVRHDPDLLFFSGDQVYEGASPSFPDRQNIELDYLYKWYLWCWAYRELARDIPCVTIPDDHDVYQGNIWGEGGRPTRQDHFGGYVHPAEFVKMVERTQTSNLPDPFDPRPIEQGIGVYFTELLIGRVSFAVIEDRKFKSGCAGRLPPTGTPRPDHIANPDFDITRADVPGLKLLGDRQLAFLRHWTGDWRGADLKVALSQTVFAGMATHHGGDLQYLRADLDSNGWPQTGRRKALVELRRGLAFHIAGDQHLSTIVQHGIDQHDDGPWTFTVPSIANFYPRKWWPPVEGRNRPPGSPPWQGQHHDGLGNPVTVYAATNPGPDTGHEPAELHDKMPGYGIVRLDTGGRTITMECWPRYADPTDPEAQYEGWPMTIRQEDNDGRRAAAWLPTLRVHGISSPVVEVRQGDERLYTIRIRGDRFDAKVFAPGAYDVRVGDPDLDVWRELSGVEAVGVPGEATIDVRF